MTNNKWARTRFNININLELIREIWVFYISRFKCMHSVLSFKKLNIILKSLYFAHKSIIVELEMGVLPLKGNELNEPFVIVYNSSRILFVVVIVVLCARINI